MNPGLGARCGILFKHFFYLDIKLTRGGVVVVNHGCRLGGIHKHQGHVPPDVTMKVFPET